ncbi:hypothetical protein E2320_022505 [Naja naja]|nr:hypothetical protein E2320_022505 [Naja naja]
MFCGAALLKLGGFSYQNCLMTVSSQIKGSCACLELPFSLATDKADPEMLHILLCSQAVQQLVVVVVVVIVVVRVGVGIIIMVNITIGVIFIFGVIARRTQYPPALLYILRCRKDLPADVIEINCVLGFWSKKE